MILRFVVGYIMARGLQLCWGMNANANIWYRIQDAAYPLPTGSVDYQGEANVPGVWVRAAAFRAVADLLWGGDDGYSLDCEAPELWLLSGRELPDYETEAGHLLAEVEVVARLTPAEAEALVRSELGRRGIEIEDLEDCEYLTDWDEIAEAALAAR